jgi:hypothetical protein
MRGVGNVVVAGITDSHGTSIANCGTGKMGQDVRLDIMTRCNNHDELVKHLSHLVGACSRFATNIDVTEAADLLARLEVC